MISNPAVLIVGWVIAAGIVYLLFNFQSEEAQSTEEIAEYATLGAFVFVLQSIPIPLQLIIPIPIIFTLSGVSLVIVVKGIRKGLLISSSAIILNHLIIPGAISALGVNLTNSLLAGITVGLLPSYIYNRLGRRARYLTAFLTGLSFVLVEGILIAVELTLSHALNFEDDLFLLVEGFVVLFLLLGIIEGFFTAIASSYYFRVMNQQVWELDDDEVGEDDDSEIDPIEFSDEEED